MAVTTKDIAERCNVSRTTVHRAFNNTGRISEETRKFILDTAEEMGYKPDLLATSLKKGRTGNIGVVVFDVKNQYFAEMLNTLDLEAQRRGYSVNISLHEKKEKQEHDMLQRLAGFRVEGIILSPVSKGSEFGEFIHEFNIPVVIIGNKIDSDIPYVGIDERSAAMEAVETIARKGYEEIYFICPPLEDIEKENVYSHVERQEGFLAKVNELNLNGHVIGKWNYLDDIDRLVDKANNRVAFFCSGDLYALDIMKHLRKRNLTAGKDYGIMGFDNIDMLDYITPRLSTIDNGVRDVSTKAVEVMFDLIDGTEVQQETIIPYTIVGGETL